MWYFEQDPVRAPLLFVLVVWAIAFAFRNRSVWAKRINWTIFIVLGLYALAHAIPLAFLLPGASMMCERCVGVL